MLLKLYSTVSALQLKISTDAVKSQRILVIGCNLHYILYLNVISAIVEDHMPPSLI